MENLWRLPEALADGTERSELLAEGPGARIERIVSSGHRTPDGAWYDQPRDEWVVLLQGAARLGYADGTTRELRAGDWLLLPAHCRHRVEQTSSAPPCIWLAVHAALRP
ncbi:MAG: cupin domain-containing protein [Proteobacteria bacterium]|nr:cupin domain-containing protein [Pseudomonadota bacterium]